MYQFSKELIDEFKDLFKKKYRVSYTDDEAQEAANNLVGYIEVLLKIAHRNKQKESKTP